MLLLFSLGGLWGYVIGILHIFSCLDDGDWYRGDTLGL